MYHRDAKAYVSLPTLTKGHRLVDRHLAGNSPVGDIHVSVDAHNLHLSIPICQVHRVLAQLFTYYDG